jgi:hypothetical protein
MYIHTHNFTSMHFVEDRKCYVGLMLGRWKLSFMELSGEKATTAVPK